jgi:hypothetical protein
VLVHHADAGVQCRARVARRQRLAVHLDVAFVGRVVAEQDRHQRGLAGPVFAQQRQHLAGAKLQRDGVVGHQRAKTLGDAVQAQDRGRGRHPEAAYLAVDLGWLSSTLTV